MGIASTLSRWMGGRSASRQVVGGPTAIQKLRVENTFLKRQLTASYDAAQTNPDNERHWAAADDYSARSANDPETRRKLRRRARYEVANNSYARGIVNTLTNDVIGTGPRLQLRVGSRPQNTAIERAFHEWGESIRLTEKLRILWTARNQDGECFGAFASNKRTPNPVQLDIRLFEADQCASTSFSPLEPNEVDGVVFDDFGDPVTYRFLKEHPGDSRHSLLFFGNEDTENIPAELVLHLYRIDRPGQLRGLPTIMAALPLFALLRRYTLASVQAAETAANFAAVLESQANAETSPDEVEPLDTIDLERNLMTTLPLGWKLGQLKAEHPTTTYAEFKHEIIKEIARCLSMPFNVAAGDSSSYNYASGRLDHQTYFKAIKVDREYLARKILDRIFRKWFDEAIREPLTSGLFSGLPPMIDWQWDWFWDGNEHVDPQKEASAEETRLKNGTLTYDEVFKREGKDWELQFEQRALEQQRMKELGISVQPDDPAGMTNKPTEDEEPAEA